MTPRTMIHFVRHRLNPNTPLRTDLKLLHVGVCEFECDCVYEQTAIWTHARQPTQRKHDYLDYNMARYLYIYIFIYMSYSYIYICVYHTTWPNNKAQICPWATQYNRGGLTLQALHISTILWSTPCFVTWPHLLLPIVSILVDITKLYKIPRQ